MGIIAACNPVEKKSAESMKPNDIHSFAQPESVVVKHIDLNLNVDFPKQVLSGKAVLTIENKSGGNELFLDTRDQRLLGSLARGP